MPNGRTTGVGVSATEDDGAETSLRESITADHATERERTGGGVDRAITSAERGVTGKRQRVRSEEVCIGGEREGVRDRQGGYRCIQGTTRECQRTRAERGTIADRETTIDEGHAAVKGVGIGGNQGARARLGQTETSARNDATERERSRGASAVSLDGRVSTNDDVRARCCGQGEVTAVDEVAGDINRPRRGQRLCCGHRIDETAVQIERARAERRGVAEEETAAVNGRGARSRIRAGERQRTRIEDCAAREGVRTRQSERTGTSLGQRTRAGDNATDGECTRGLGVHADLDRAVSREGHGTRAGVE